MDITLPWPPALILAAVGLAILVLAAMLHVRRLHKLEARVATLEQPQRQPQRQPSRFE